MTGLPGQENSLKTTAMSV